MRELRDPLFPGLATALDTDAMLPILAEGLVKEDELQLQSVSVSDVRYRPGEQCWILYRVKGRDARSHTRRTLVAARVLRRGDEVPAPTPTEVRKRYLAHDLACFGRASAYLPSVHMMVYAFPVDTALPGLLDAVDPRAMKRLLSRVWGGRGLRVLDVRVKPRGYTPHARAALGYEVLCEDRKTGMPEMRRLLGKMHAKKPAARLFADAWLTWRAGRRRVSLAPPVEYLGDVGVTLQEIVPGERLGALVAAPGFLRRVKRTARMLAGLHDLQLPLSSRRKPEEEAQGVHRWAGVLAAIRPDLAPRVESLRDRLAARLVEECRMSGPIHADFHHTNVLVDGDRITLIDLDEMAFGDPMVDVGRFLASLRVPARRAFGRIDALADAGDAFLEEYMRCRDGDSSGAHLFEAASLLIAAGSSFRIQREGWEEEVQLLVEESERVLETATGGPRITRSEARARPELSDETKRTWAEDAVFMRATLHPHVQRLYGFHLTSCQVRRSGSDRDALRYDLRGWDRDKQHRLGLQGIPWPHRGGRAALERLERLRKALDRSSPAPIVPRPVVLLKPLGILVREIPDGTPLSKLLESEEGLFIVERVAESLAVLHRATVQLETERPLPRVLHRLQERVATLERARLSDRARGLADRIGSELAGLPDRRAPILRTVDPHHVLWTGDRVVFTQVDSLNLGHPLLDVGDFLARMTWMALRRNREPEIRHVLERFRQAYTASLRDGDGLAAFEAEALLRLACNRWEREPGSPGAEMLLETAEGRLVG
jgi:Ser/Thr protein kinase RdoA (MazF antagonist)